jgi:hypothetical protein
VKPENVSIDEKGVVFYKPPFDFTPDIKLVSLKGEKNE